MGPALVLGQDLAHAAGPTRDGAVADLATGDRQLGNDYREAAGGDLLILHQRCQRSRSDHALSLCRTHSTRS
jgi:hypothetical protein